MEHLLNLRNPSTNCKWKSESMLLLTGLLLQAQFLFLLPEVRSEFNVVLPEICGVEGRPVNISRIREMVLLGIREERPQLGLNILPPKEICDGSGGFIKFIAEAERRMGGQMMASLNPHLCQVAASIAHSKREHFVSWTCPKLPGVVSIKPGETDVLLAATNLISYLDWRKFAFTRLRDDKSPYCEELANKLDQRIREGEKTEVLVLSKYDDIYASQYSAVLDKVEGVFLCLSYEYWLSTQKTETPFTKTKTDHKGDSYHSHIPTVLLPEWPLPLESLPTLVEGKVPQGPPLFSLIAHPDPYKFNVQGKSESPSSHSSASPERGVKGPWEGFVEFNPREPERARQRILEPLLSRLILRAIKVSMEFEWGRNSDSDDNPQPKSKGTSTSSSFRFLVFKYEKDRWHPLVNLEQSDNPENNPLGARQRDLGILSIRESDYEKNQDSILSWLIVLVGILLTAILIYTLFKGALYAREKYESHMYTAASSVAESANQKKLVPRTRTQGAYKLLLTSRDICFHNPVPVSTNVKQSLLQIHPPVSFDAGSAANANANTSTDQLQSPISINVPVVGGNSNGNGNNPFSRTPSGEEGQGLVANGGPGEKPDLIKGSVGPSGPPPLKKGMSLSNMKNDSIILTENQARYKGDLVHLRKLHEPTSEPFEIQAKALTVLETIHGLRHENVVGLIGVLTDGMPAMVWEFCSRGSLHDILKSRDIKLDWAFKLSLLTDLVRGMKYLHSSLVRVHGFLSSRNCVIDGRWVLKITDYGVLSFHHNQALPLPQRSNKELLWTAPELLRDETLRRHGTQAGDVYSFAIIMQEVLLRGEPYCMLNLGTEEILEKLRKPPPLIRPSVSKGAAPPEAINIMRQCWSEAASQRPDFTVIHELFKTLNHGRKANIVDTMFEMLEKYSNNLEELIRERTEQLDLEKKKTEQLLNRMLPSTVAEKLKLGLPVDPEEFPEVTIYFSDIVGFTTISAYSTPFEVVDLLNDLYTCFDATINDYNVYKVETIGDAYMVVGGAPLRSGDHVDQIATMALDLLHESGKFRIRHLPYTPLRLRIGIHTGPCCSGVVGLTMPRYCLFGDTVNTASRMESTGAPWRIHISSNTKSKLHSIGGYIIEYRGMTDIKGKGKMPTYWLLGKEGFDKELPKPPSLTENHGLSEKLILYGRTGIPPGSQENLQLLKEKGFRDSRPNSQEGSASLGVGLTDQGQGQKGPTFSLLQGEALRCLSPAEEVAHQLLNGRPAVRGLRRQFSLDQGSNYYIAPARESGKLPFRKTPSLEEPSAPVDFHPFKAERKKLCNFSGTHQLSIEVPVPVSTKSGSSSGRAATFTRSAPNSFSSPPPTPQEKEEKGDNNELSPDNTCASASKANKVTLSPRTGRIFIKSSSLTIVEESPTQE